MKPTVLAITVQALGGPVLTDRTALTQWVSAYRAPTPRHREILEYVHQVSMGIPARHPTARGSLKHFLWWLRDHAGDLYEQAAIATIHAAIEHPGWGIGAIADQLTTHPLLAGFAQQALQAKRTEDLTHRLTFEDSPRGVSRAEQEKAIQARSGREQRTTPRR